MVKRLTLLFQRNNKHSKHSNVIAIYFIEKNYDTSVTFLQASLVILNTFEIRIWNWCLGISQDMLPCIIWDVIEIWRIPVKHAFSCGLDINIYKVTNMKIWNYKLYFINYRTDFKSSCHSVYWVFTLKRNKKTSVTNIW